MMIPSTRDLVVAFAAFVALTLVAPPPAAAAPAKTVICKDGTKDEGGQGACSGHGGIDKAATDKAASKGAKKHKEPAEPKAAMGEEPAARPPPREKSEHAAQPATHPGEKAADPAKGPPTARCKDGTLSYSEHHTGACSNHGGVEEWLDKK